MLTIIAHTDGACSGNPGVGGYAGILTCNGKERKVTGHSKEVTTNNKMELRAVIAVVEWVNKYQKEPCKIEIHTDSQYIIDCTAHKNKSWYSKRPNNDLWLELITAGNKGGHKISFVKVQGHSGDAYNERCDKMAKEECKKAKHELIGG